MNRHIKWMILGVFLALAGWFYMPTNACADNPGQGPYGATGGGGTIAPQTCDTQVWKTMEARARIETEREIMQNQNLIFKPDSILNYVCFDSLAGHAAAHVGVLFTHTTYWGKLIIRWGSQDPGLDHAINKVVIDSMKQYFAGNFAHAYLGGRATEYMAGGGTTPGGNRPGFPPTPVAATPSSTYACSEMAKIWAVAKCANFMHTPNLAKTDGYYPFLNLTAGPGGGQNIPGYQTYIDIRKYPTPCNPQNPLPGSTWEKMYRQSRNELSFGDPNLEYQFGKPLQMAFKEVRDKIEPGKCDGKPILTGVTVIRGPNSTQNYQDGVCTNPGCTFMASGQQGACKAGSGSTSNVSGSSNGNADENTLDFGGPR